MAASRIGALKEGGLAHVATRGKSGGLEFTCGSDYRVGRIIVPIWVLCHTETIAHEFVNLLYEHYGGAVPYCGEAVCGVVSRGG